MTGASMFPDTVFTLWTVTVVLALVVFVPLSVYMLASLLRAARSIQHYAREAVAPAQAIAANTAAVPALDGTIAVATEVLAAAEGVAQKLDTIATVLEARAGSAERRDGDVMLVTLTLVIVALVVLALAGFLALVAFALLDARKSVGAIADALEAVAAHTTPLEQKLVTINGALGALRRRPGRRGSAPRTRRARVPPLRGHFMCFKNLPVEFDKDGRPYLKEGVADPYTPTRTAPVGAPMQLSAGQVEELVRRNGHIKSVDFDPVTRIAGALALPHRC